MPRFYFDLHKGDRVTRDGEGQEFVDVDAAEREAEKSVVQIYRDHDGEPHETATIDVRDEHGRIVAVVTASLEVSPQRDS